MKSGVVLEWDWLDAIMINCVDHDSASNAAPKSRHHLKDKIIKRLKINNITKDVG